MEDKKLEREPYPDHTTKRRWTNDPPPDRIEAAKEYIRTHPTKSRLDIKARQEAVLTLAAEGVDPVQAMRENGLNARTLRNWLQSHPDFRKQYAAVRDIIKGEVIGRMFEITTEGSERNAIESAKVLLTLDKDGETPHNDPIEINLQIVQATIAENPLVTQILGIDAPPPLDVECEEEDLEEE